MFRSSNCIDSNKEVGSSSFGINQIANVSDCLFVRSQVFIGDGGVICLKDNNLYSIVVKRSTFYNCQVDSVNLHYGGAICVWCNNAESQLYMICASDCRAKAVHFADLYTSKSKNNTVEYLSVTRCSNAEQGFFSTVLGYGYTKYDYSNSSLNNADFGSGFRFAETSSFTSHHCSFSHNKDAKGPSILGTKSLGSFEQCNIVHNTCLITGIISTENNGEIAFQNCVFHNNHGTLFNSTQGSISVSGSSVYHIDYLSWGSITLSNNNNGFTSTFMIEFYSSNHCYANANYLEKNPQTILRVTKILPTAFVFSLIQLNSFIYLL